MNKALMTLTGMFLLTPFAHASTCEDAKRVFTQLEKSTNLHPKFQCIVSKDVNAYTSLTRVLITTGILNIMNSEDEIALVLGHELTHYKYKDARHSGSSFYELRADKEGYILCKKEGYNKCALFFIRMMALEPGDPGDGIHPSWDIRYKQIMDL